MPTARELLEQADALMRRNRGEAAGAGRVVHASPMPAPLRPAPDAGRDAGPGTPGPAARSEGRPAEPANGFGTRVADDVPASDALQAPLTPARMLVREALGASEPAPGAPSPEDEGGDDGLDRDLHHELGVPGAGAARRTDVATARVEDDDGFPVLVDAVSGAPGLAIAGDEDVPVLTEAVEEIEAPPPPDAGTAEPEPRWEATSPEPGPAAEQGTGDAAVPATVPPPVQRVTDLPLDFAIAAEIDAELDTQATTIVHMPSGERAMAEIDAELAREGHPVAIDPHALTAYPDLPYGMPDADAGTGDRAWPGTPPAAADHALVEQPAAPEADSPAAASFAAALQGGADAREAEVPAAASRYPGGRDEAEWNALAEEIRMQVLQRIDIFTDTGLRTRLGERLKPVVDRASAELVETLNQQVGEILRAYVAEAIEREIERWRNGDER